MIGDSVVHDVAIVGGGPAGLFTAQGLIEGARVGRLSVVLLEMGPEPEVRGCPADDKGCKHCNLCTVISGLGGAGLRSDGKLVLDLSSGGHVQEFTNLTERAADDLVERVVSTLKRHDGDSEMGPDSRHRNLEISEQFAKIDLSIKVYPVLHLGTKNLTKIMGKFAESLRNHQDDEGVALDVVSRCEVLTLDREEGHFRINTSKGEYRARRVVLAAGKSGSTRVRQFLGSEGLSEIQRPVWLGVRVDAPHAAGRDLLAISFDPKISMQDAHGRVKTHCFCRHGSVLIMKHRGAVLVGGHSQLTKNNHQNEAAVQGEDRVSFNVIASRVMDADTIQLVYDTFARVGKDSVSVQDLGSFLDPTSMLRELSREIGSQVPARTADIRRLLDDFLGVGSSIAEFIRRLGRRYPDLAAPTNLVYAPVVEWDFGTIKVDERMQTKIPGLYAVGDGAGLSQGIVHAGATGLICAEGLLSDLRQEKQPGHSTE